VVIGLSQIPNWPNLSAKQVIDWMLDNGFRTLINDYGIGMEYELDDIDQVWEDIIGVLT
jgi:hypothetical protein